MHEKTRMIQKTVGVVVALLSVFLLGGGARPDDSPIDGLTVAERAWLHDNPEKLVLLYDGAFPPVEFRSGDGNFAGIGADIISRVEEFLGIRFICRPADDWNTVVADLQSGRSAISTGITRTADREQHIFFTQPYLSVPVVIITNRKQSGELQLNDLAGWRIGAVSGYTSERYLHDQALLNRFTLVPVADVAAGLQKVAFGEIDAFVESLASAAYYIDEIGIPGLRVAGKTDLTFDLCLGISREYPLLISAAQKALNAIPASELTQIQGKWIALKINSGPDPRILPFIKIAALFTGLLLAGLLGITIALKRRLDQRLTDLRHSEKRYRRLAENSPAVVYQFLMAPDGTFSIPYVSEAVLGLTGVMAKTVMQDAATILAMIHPEDVASFRLNILESARELSPYHDSFRYLKDGHCAWIEARSLPERRPDGSILWDGFLMDVTERKAMEQTLRDSEERYRAIVEDQTEIIVRFNQQGIITFANKVYDTFIGAHLPGVATGGIIGRSIWDIMQEPNYAEIKQFLTSLAQSHASQSMERKFISKDGAPCWVEWRIRALHDSNGQAGEYQAVGSIITERKLAEEALRASENKLRSLFAAMQDVIMVLDAEGRYLEIAPTTTGLLYRPPAEILGKTLTEVVPLALAELGLECIRDVLGHDERRFLEYQMEIGGQSVWFAANVSPFTANSVLWVARDITAQKLAGLALQVSEEKYRRLIADLPGVVYQCADDPDLTMFYISDAIHMLSGYPAADFINSTVRSFSSIIHPDDRAMVARALQRGIENKKMYTLEYRIIRADGGITWVHERGHGVFEDNGNLSQIEGIILDITARKQAEEALRESEERYKSIITVSNTGVWEYHHDTGQVWCSPEYFAMLGLDPDHLVLAGLAHIKEVWTDRLHPDDRETATSTLADYIAGGSVGMYENFFRLRHKAGHWVWIWSRGQTLRDREGKPTSVTMGTHIDITERKRAEAEKDLLQEQLLQAQKMESVGRLAGGVAHDFNNMLGVIIGHTEMVMDQTGPSGPLFDSLQEIHKAAVRSADLTRQLLAFARKQTAAPKVLDLNETIEGMLKMLRRLIGEDIDLNWLPGGVPVKVMMDPSQVDQILANLCVNARDAIMDTGMITIETGATILDRTYCAEHTGFVPGDYVILTVSDNGCGMDRETIEHLFEPFFTTKDLGKGTGLGLATVYGIVKQNDGFINVYSEPGQGSTFRIYLPSHAAQVSPPPRTEGPEPTVSGSETILLVEDENAILDMTTKILRKHGYTILATADPNEALRLAREHPAPIALLISDVIMPGMNGRDLARKILEFQPHLKFLFMSGYTASIITRRGVLEEGTNFIQKPFRQKDLVIKVRAVLDAPAAGIQDFNGGD